MLITDVLLQIVLVDHFIHIVFDFSRGRNRCADPWLETITECVEIAVGADAWIFMRVPRAAECFELVEHHECFIRVLCFQMISRADAGNACTDDENIEMFDLVC